jgi:hypothetical protein
MTAINASTYAAVMTPINATPMTIIGLLDLRRVHVVPMVIAIEAWGASHHWAAAAAAI